jgi:hypothetical protein
VAALNIYVDGDRTKIEVTGSVDAAAVEQLRTHIDASMLTGTCYLMVDLSQAHDVIPCMINPMLESVAAQLRARSGLMATVGAAMMSTEDMASASLDEIFTLYQRLRSALEYPVVVQPA